MPDIGTLLHFFVSPQAAEQRIDELAAGFESLKTDAFVGRHALITQPLGKLVAVSWLPEQQPRP